MLGRPTVPNACARRPAASRASQRVPQRGRLVGDGRGRSAESIVVAARRRASERQRRARRTQPAARRSPHPATHRARLRSPGSSSTSRAPPPTFSDGLHRPGVALGHLGDDRQAEAGAGHACGTPRTARTARRRAAGPPRGCPGPRRRRSARRRCSRTVTVPSGGLHLAALSSRLVTARSSAGGLADHPPRLGVRCRR